MEQGLALEDLFLRPDTGEDSQQGVKAPVRRCKDELSRMRLSKAASSLGDEVHTTRHVARGVVSLLSLQRRGG